MPTNERRCWQATKKPDIRADEWAAVVGGQRKNQTLKGETDASATLLPFKFMGANMAISKQQIAGSIKKAAITYKQELLDRNILVVFGDASKPQIKEMLFEIFNFEHLTGVVSKIKAKDSKKLFFDKAVVGNLSINDFEVNKNGTSEIKSIVIEQAVMLAHTAKRIGDYNNLRPKLEADSLTGTSKWCIAFRDTGSRYLRPCSLLNDDIKNNTSNSQPILAVFRRKRNISNGRYSEITCIGKDINMPRLAATIDKLYPELLARTLYGLEKNPNMKNPTADPYIAVEYKLSDGVCTKIAELYTGTKADCDRLIQSYSEDKPPPKIELYQLTDSESEQSKQLIEAISSGTGAPTEDMYTKTYEYSFFKSDDKDWCTKKLQEAYSRFTADLPNDFHGRKLGTGDVIVIDKHPFVLSGVKLKRVPTFFKAKVQEKSMDTAEKAISDDKTTDKAKLNPQKHKR
ncbi:PBECR4 domain-containing protein [Huintestinicola sp.]|uniref:PBECR4 domain-containing protein n=1 Tax=Huintestinicola sp. TaxID=2981661 RepID=UPI003D7C4E17